MATKSSARTILAGAAAGALLLTGCSSSPDSGGGGSSAGEENVLRMALESAPPGGWDPTMWAWDGYTIIQEAAYDSLIRNTANGLAPGLAETWEWVSPTEFRLELHDGIEFVDGDPLDSAAVKQNLEHFRDADGRFSAQLSPIVDIQTPTETEVVIELSAPLTDLELLLSQNAGLMVSPAALADPTILSSEPVGVSGYLLDTEVSASDVRYVFEKNENYWNADDVKFDSLEFEIQNDRSASFNSLLAGQLDLVWGIAEGQEMAESNGIHVYAPAGVLLTIMINDYGGTSNDAFADVRVRQAMNYAVDREALARDVVPGEPIGQLFTPNTDAYIPALDDAYPYDVEKARELMAEAGYSDGVTLPILTTPDYTNLVSAVAGYFSEVGIELDIRTLELQEYIAEVTSANAPMLMGRASTQSAYADMLNYIPENGARNPYRNEIPAAAELFSGVLDVSAEERTTLYHQIAEIVSEEAIAVPLLRESIFFYYNDNVDNLVLPDGYVLPTLHALEPGV